VHLAACQDELHQPLLPFRPAGGAAVTRYLLRPLASFRRFARHGHTGQVAQWFKAAIFFGLWHRRRNRWTRSFAQTHGQPFKWRRLGPKSGSYSGGFTLV
jgi:hypothetical protein